MPDRRGVGPVEADALRRSGGFSLVEAAIALGIAASLAVAGVSFLSTTGKVSRRMHALQRAQQDADLIVRVLSHTIRQAGTGGGTAGVVAGSESAVSLQLASETVTFESAPDGDVVMRRGFDRYRLNQPDMRASLAFEYLDPSGVAFPRCGGSQNDALACVDVRAIRLRVTVASKLYPGEPVDVATALALRGASF